MPRQSQPSGSTKSKPLAATHDAPILAARQQQQQQQQQQPLAASLANTPEPSLTSATSTPRRIGWLASHLGDRCEIQAELRYAILAAVQRVIDRAGGVLWVAPGTAAADLAFAAAELIPRLSIKLISNPHSQQPQPRRKPSAKRSPTGDRHLVSCVDEVHLLYLRPKGRIASCLSRLLDSPDNTPSAPHGDATNRLSHQPLHRHTPRLLIANHPGLIPIEQSRRWLAQGARLLEAPTYSHQVTTDTTTDTTTSIVPSQRQTLPRCPRSAIVQDSWAPHQESRIQPLQPCDLPDRLVHCTRASDRRRAGESRVDFARRLLTTEPRHWGDSSRTLAEILSENRLRGSRSATGTNVPVVCFSAVMLPDLLKRRCFRKGRRHWDYEPFGLSFKRSALLALGARPVRYLTSQEYAHQLTAQQSTPWAPCKQREPRSLGYSSNLPTDPQSHQQASHPDDLRTWVQLQSQDGEDWSRELEWRCIGDLPFDKLPPAAAFVFVPDWQTARRLTWLTPLPIRVVT